MCERSLERIVNARHERTRTEEQVSGCIVRVGVRLRPMILVFSGKPDVGAHQNLEAWTEAVSSLILGYSVCEIGRRVHKVIPHGRDQPGIDPVVAGYESPGIGNRMRFGERRWINGSIINMVRVVTNHSQGQ